MVPQTYSDDNESTANIEEIDARVQEDLYPYFDHAEEREGKVVEEDDDAYYMLIHINTPQIMVEEDVLSWDEAQAIFGHYHEIVEKKWRHQDIESRHMNAMETGDRVALVLKKQD